MFLSLLLSVIWKSLEVMFLVAWPILKWFLIILIVVVTISMLRGIVSAKTKKK